MFIVIDTYNVVLFAQILLLNSHRQCERDFSAISPVNDALRKTFKLSFIHLKRVKQQYSIAGKFNMKIPWKQYRK